MSKSETLGGIAYIGLLPVDVIRLLARLESIESKKFGTINFRSSTNLSPDYFELAVLRPAEPTVKIMLQCFMLPVYSRRGVAFQLAFRWVSAQNSPWHALERNLVVYLIEEFDSRIQQAGAKATILMPKILVEGDVYQNINLEDAFQVATQLVSKNKKILDLKGNLSSWNGTLAWSSPRTGAIAGEFDYRVANSSHRIFLRWDFFYTGKQNEIGVSYECYAGQRELDNRNSNEWLMIRTLVIQTSLHLCAIGATQIRHAFPTVNAPQTVAAKSNTPLKVTELTATGTNFFAAQRPFWPMAHDFSEALQNRHNCVADEEIRQGILLLDHLELPKVVSGNFACVYRIKLEHKDIAVRCFTNAISDQAERYRRISRFVCSDDLPYTIDFDFQDRGILIKGSWFPLVKMNWIEGESLSSYISRQLDHPHTAHQKLRQLRDKFAIMMEDLAIAGVAHGDLQHGNILLRNGEFLLIDYDGMFVPDLLGFKSKERGHPSYQHPQREAHHFGTYLDHFSAWIIDSALFAIEKDPSLWKKFGEGDESLLFRRADLVQPEKSKLFLALERHRDKALSERASFLRHLLRADPLQIPPLAAYYPELLELETKRGGPLPDWMS